MIVVIFVSTQTRSKLSAVVPISNYEQHKANIESILRSAAACNIEMILVLDSEPNNAYEELVHLTKNINNTQEVLKVYSGNPGSARNFGKKRATRDWVTFWDCDDYPIIDSILESIKKAELNEAEICVGAYLIEDTTTKIERRVSLDVKYLETQIGINPGVWRMAFKRSLIADIDFPELSMAEDQIFLQRVLNREPRISYFNVDTYRYRTGVLNQLTGNPRKRWDLTKAHELASREYNPKINSRDVTSTMLVRQELSILKYIDSSTKKRIKIFISLIKKTPDVFRTLFVMLNGYFFIHARGKLIK